MCGSSYGNPTLQFSSTSAFQQYGTALGLEITSESAQTNSIDVKMYEAIYGIAGIHGNYPAPPGVRSSMVLGSPANGRTAYTQTEGNCAASGVQIRTIEACCTPANYVGALNVIFSDNSRKKVLYGTRYGAGRVVGTAAKSITDLCCKAGSDQGMNSLLLRQALWAAAYGIKLGGAKVSTANAEWLVAAAATLTTADKNGLKAPPNGNGNNPEWHLPLDVFTAQYNDPRFNKPGSFVVDLYIIGPENPPYGDYHVNRTVQSYVYNSSRGLFVIGPDQSYYDALWGTAAWASTNLTGAAMRRHRRQLPEVKNASAFPTAAGAGNEAAAVLEELQLIADLLEAQGEDWDHYSLTSLPRTPLPAISTIVVSSSTLTNCQRASIMYTYYLQKKLALGPADVSTAVKTISIARGSYALSDPWASRYFWPYQDDIQFYGGVIPNQPPPSPPPPPPTILKRPPPPATS
ncbi:hypothetical protein HXX76_005694 [Chlamydomonas incerta]|uniref:Uncharacterized protein n=1 Tax=Chlamydomonas incerta TaxID=51695 RepID=A0A835W3M5_CHLIN|nr:hypothetical protein HXX76_005694 [Chlamydomonas incerta]|eukprot:KAG2438085.1 hypothetical protein HXX76_005694 [Chlamydomonas incerta]